MKRLLLLLPLLLLGALPAKASIANYYVAATSAGSGDHSSCANAGAYTDLNISGNWGNGSTQIGPDTTVHLCGTITGAAGAQLFCINGGGTSGHPITILWETNAVLQAPYSSIFGLICNGSGWDYIWFDGGSNGVIQGTDNGSGLTYQVTTGGGIYISGGTGNVVKNLTIRNFYQHTDFNDNSGVEGGGISMLGGASNFTITQNTIHDNGVGISINSAGTDSVVSFNTIYRENWGMNVGNGPIARLEIKNNDISCVAGTGGELPGAPTGSNCNWMSSGNTYHNNGIMIDPQVGFVSDNVYHDNFIHDVNPSSAYFFFDCSYANCVSGTLLYNNIWFTSPGMAGAQNGFSGLAGQAYNNTMVNAGPAWGINHDDNSTLKNNILNSFNYGIIGSNFSTPLTGGLTSDYNDWYNGGVGIFTQGGTTYTTLSDWQANNNGQDTHSINTNPTLGSDFTLIAGSPAIGAGTNLTSLAIAGLDTGAPQTFGRGSSCGTGCVARPAMGAWDLGAYPSGSGGGSPFVSLSPTSKNYGNVTINTDSSSQTFTLTNSGTATLNITSITTSDGTIFPLTNSCGATVAMSANCTFSAKFHPTSAINYNGTLTITTDALSSPDTIPLTGTGVSSPAGNGATILGTGTILGSGSIK